MSEKDTNRVKWNRDETILAYDLYCRTSFENIKTDNLDIIQLANIIGRTPGSVKAKMNNLAHFDPELQEKNIDAMAHTSKLDCEIVNEFLNDWGSLSYQALMIRAKLQNKDFYDIVSIKDINETCLEEYREELMKVRAEQYFFRMTVLSAYANQCCITGLKIPDLLVASHIKPWNVSDAHTERANPHNGLSLNALLDQAFEKGFITIDQNYKVVISKKLKNVDMDSETKSWFWKYSGENICMPRKFLPGKEFIQYHNDMVFQG